MGKTWNFDPARLAELEAAGWEAYYARNWPRAFWLLVLLCREQFRLSWLSALRAAYYVTRASMAFAPKENDVPATKAYLEKFYATAKANAGYDPQRAAELELRYWIVHRQLVGNPDKADMIQALAELHSTLFGLPMEKVHRSAELRSAAAETVDRITSRTSTDIAQDWNSIRHYLTQAYSEIRQALAGGKV
ncbi:MAG: hypothetical protein HYX86_03520 [Chloroflexi bacterium]|nr:hypothetical protein [Chloroflexota bacterium]